MKIVEQKHITCIFPKGVALQVSKTLKTEKGIMSTNINNARGVGKITPLAYRGIAGQSEKEIMTVTVPDDQAEEIFEFIYNEADVNQPHGGLIYMYKIHRATSLELPDVPDET